MKIDSSNVSVIVPPGRYILGDPCYSISGDHWDELLETCDYFEQPVGHVSVSVPAKNFVYERFHVLGFQTAYGDGTYKGSDGNSYSVDAGLIGLVPVELAEALGALDETSPNYVSGKVIVEFHVPTTCSNEGGYMKFGNIVIDTEGYDEDDYEGEDDDYWDPAGQPCPQ